MDGLSSRGYVSRVSMPSRIGKARRGLGPPPYRVPAGGWLRGKEVSTNIFDTGLTILALRAAQIPDQDPLISRAVAFLKEAASPDHHMWSWSYYPGMGTNRRYLDTDDTGLACMALASCGEPKHSQVLTEAARGLLGMQENSGAFSTFGDGAIRPNWCWLSIQVRALQALMVSGFSFAT